ncbi:hypothetical protein KM043_008267 [Ampulex compressa]|nr:hypothetical protein KM043_008267 [Ampulex compressa]
MKRGKRRLVLCTSRSSTPFGSPVCLEAFASWPVDADEKGREERRREEISTSEDPSGVARGHNYRSAPARTRPCSSARGRSWTRLIEGLATSCLGGDVPTPWGTSTSGGLGEVFLWTHSEKRRSQPLDGANAEGSRRMDGHGRTLTRL